MTQPNEIDVAAEELRAQLRRALLVARVVSRRVPRASTGLDHQAGRAARSTAVLATRWPREAAAARWAAATVARERARERAAEHAAAVDAAPGDLERVSGQHPENHQVVERDAAAWDERVRASGVDPEQVRSTEPDSRPTPEAGTGQQPQATSPAVGEELVTEYLAEAYTETALDGLDHPPAPAVKPSVGDLIAATELRGVALTPGENTTQANAGRGVDTSLDPELDPVFDPGRDTSADRGADEGVGW